MRSATDFTLRDQKRGSGQVEHQNQNYFKEIYTPFYCFGSNRIESFQVKI
jgi:hypothetical protein